ncbi:MAG: twin-arginine translocase TatA/TatE family subunit [Pyrinomonadaceae bacterium]|nr:twin-arginine translocase TatA/TatE family subunit [Pyrinomonadaceae bacterium]
MFFLFLESIGTTELILILVVALVVFGPRKLPELGRSLGRSIGEFRRASEDFKRTWEMEVEAERHEKPARVEELSAAEETVAPPAPTLAEGTIARDALQSSEAQSDVFPSAQPTASTSLPIEEPPRNQPAQS